MSEKTVENRIRRHCLRKGLLVLKLRIMGMRGWPDLTIIGPGGWMYFIEVKDVGKENNASVQQRFWLRKLESFGFHAEIFSDAEEACAAIDAWLLDEEYGYVKET